MTKADLKKRIAEILVSDVLENEKLGVTVEKVVDLFHEFGLSLIPEKMIVKDAKIYLMRDIAYYEGFNSAIDRIKSNLEKYFNS